MRFGSFWFFLRVHYEKCVPAWVQKIDESFLSDEMKDKYVELIYERIGRIIE